MQIKTVFAVALLMLATAALWAQDAPKTTAVPRGKMIFFDHFPEGAVLVAAPAATVTVAQLAVLPTKSHFVFKGVKGMSLLTEDCDPAVDAGCDDGHGLSPPPDPNCVQLSCWYIGYGWYICYVGC